MCWIRNMTSTALVCWFVLFNSFFPPVNGHLCLITPRQRGAMDISTGGSHTCFRHGTECGGEPPAPLPYPVLIGGRPVFIKWQQNFNHYSVGYPGYMDIAIAVANGNASLVPDPFMTLATVADVDQFDQAHQQNYTAVVTLPNMDCDHCVIRARYAAHKPGETTFYQCADVRLTRSSNQIPVPYRQNRQLQLLDGDSLDSNNTLMYQGTKYNEAQIDIPNLPKHPKDIRRRLEIPVVAVYQTGSENQATEDPRPPSRDRNFHGNKTKTSSEVFLRRAIKFLREHSPKDTYSTPSVEHHPRMNTASLSPNSASGTPPLNTDPSISPDVPLVDTSSPKLYGLANSIDSDNSSVYLSIDTLTGERTELNRLSFGVDSTHGSYVTDGVMTFDPARGLTLMTYNSHDNMDALADRIVELNSDTGAVQSIVNISAYDNKSAGPKSAFSAIVVEIEDSYVTFNIEPDNAESGGFYFVVGRLYRGGSWEQLSKTDTPENTFVNFLWADFDIAVKTLYVLLGNENDPYGLSAKLYKFFVPPGHPLPDPIDFYSSVTVDTSHFPFMAFYISNLHTNQLYAMSPGLWNQSYPAFHLVVLDVDTGSVTDLGPLTPAGIFERHYGGAVFNGFNANSNTIVHVLRVADTQADVIMSVNTFTRDVKFSEVTNLRNIRNLAYAWNVE